MVERNGCQMQLRMQPGSGLAQLSAMPQRLRWNRATGVQQVTLLLMWAVVACVGQVSEPPDADGCSVVGSAAGARDHLALASRCTQRRAACSSASFRIQIMGS